MPKGINLREQRIQALKKMKGSDFVMSTVATDFVLLAKEERAKAVRMLAALNDTISKEEAATA